MNFKTKTVIKDKGHLYNDERANEQEDIPFVSIYESNIGAPRYTKQLLTELKREMTSAQ